jgi:hypothetical protein
MPDGPAQRQQLTGGDIVELLHNAVLRRGVKVTHHFYASFLISTHHFYCEHGWLP